MAVTSVGYLPWIGEVLSLRAARSGARIALRRAPTVDVTVVDVDGKPIPRAGAGWFVETKDGIMARYEVCCTSEDGKLSFGLDGVAEGRVTVFAVAGEPPSRFGVAALKTVAGQHYPALVKADLPLQTVLGRVVDASGAPLAALVSVEPAPGSTFSSLDRVLLASQSEDTDRKGNFERHITTPAPAVLQLRAWTGLGNGTPHVQTETLSQLETRFDAHPRPVVLTAPAVPVVRCTMVGPDGAKLRLSELGISFVPHGSPGHSGSCVWPGGPARADADEERKATEEVRFVWPRAAETLLVFGRGSAAGRPRPAVGETRLERASDPCQILGR